MQALSYLTRQTLTVRGPERCFSRSFAPLRESKKVFSVTLREQKAVGSASCPFVDRTGFAVDVPVQANVLVSWMMRNSVSRKIPRPIMERNWRFAWLLKAVIPQAGQPIKRAKQSPRTE